MLTALFAQKRQVMLDKVVAVVGASSILYSEVQDYAAQLVEQRRQEGYTSDRDPMNEALEALMTRKLLYHQGQIDSVQVSDTEILSRVEDQVQMMIDQENLALFIERLKEHLSKMERQVLDYYISGLNYQQIAEEMGKSPKAIDNALQRIKAKVKEK